MPGFVNYKKGCTRLTVTSDKVYQLLAHGRWFSPGTPASSTTKTRRHDIAEILLKVALNTNNPKSIKLYDHKHDDTFIECIVFVINTFASKQIWIKLFPVVQVLDYRDFELPSYYWIMFLQAWIYRKYLPRT